MSGSGRRFWEGRGWDEVGRGWGEVGRGWSGVGGEGSAGTRERGLAGEVVGGEEGVARRRGRQDGMLYCGVGGGIIP